MQSVPHTEQVQCDLHNGELLPIFFGTRCVVLELLILLFFKRLQVTAADEQP
jgi:hypothetical protein